MRITFRGPLSAASTGAADITGAADRTAATRQIVNERIIFIFIFALPEVV
jgi:hypothetical protein